MTAHTASEPPVTWLLAVRNGMPFLTEMLASIRAQSYHNWQVLAWDNGSSDGTVEELRRWIPQRLPGRIIAGRPLPLADSRARLVEAARTDLCAVIDADDVNDPRRLELQVEFLEAHPQVAAVGGQLRPIDAEGRTIGERGWFPIEYGDILADMLTGPALAQPAVLFRRAAVLQVGSYRDVGPVNVEDYDLWLRLAARYQLANLEAEVLTYRVHTGSTTVISGRDGVLGEATRERFAELAPRVYGCTAREARLLADQRHPFALPVLLRIARRISERSGRPLANTVRSRHFRYAAMRLLAPHDVASRSALWAIGRWARRFPGAATGPGDAVGPGDGGRRRAEMTRMNGP